MELDEIVREFLLESHENLDQLDQDLIALEHEPESRPLLASIFRTIHTVKGTCGFLPFPRLESVAHVGESVLAQLRDGRLDLTPDMVSALLQLVDAIRGALARIETTGEEGTADHAALIATLTALQDPEQQPAAAREPYSSPVLVGPVVGSQPLGQVLVQQGATGQDDVTLAVLAQASGDDRRIGDILVGLGATSADQVAEALETQVEVGRSAADRSIRVDVDLLDSLMRLVGELVLTRNQIQQHVAAPTEGGLARSSQRLNLLANELQEGVMKTRLQPIDNVWSKLARVVRDLGVACGKQVRLELQGRDTELDKTLLEAIRDPLTHCVRNAVDHGIEAPDERQAAGKPAEGTLLLRAFHEGGQVYVEVTDDGRGIDPFRLAAKAVEQGLVTQEQIARMTERELLHLVFLPGLSTAGEVTTVSGRGVGMDVVKTNIEKIGGTVELTSSRGRGTTFRFTIPLTLAIIPALTVACGSERYAIPQVSLVELVRLDAEEESRDASKSIEYISGFPVLRLRGSLLPLVHLDEQLGLTRPADDTAATFIVVLQADGRQFGLVVHKVLDTEEIVVKPLGSQLKGLGLFAGATILGDGAVALILDGVALARQAHVLSAGARPSADDAARRAQEVAVQPLLVVGCGGRRTAIPLEMVTRLEQFPAASLERVGAREVVQYRDMILPLARVGGALGAGNGTGADPLHVVVYSERGRSVGLVVDAIVDITHERVVGESDIEDDGLLGSAVVQGKVTEMLDVRRAIVAVDPHFYDAVLPEQAGSVA